MSTEHRYVHLIATRGTGLGRSLYEAFTETARRQGAVRLKAITSVTNEGSIFTPELP